MLRDTLDTLADLWSCSTERRDLTSRMGGVYRNEWRDFYGTHILANEIEKRYPHTFEMLLAVADTSVNAFRWACGKLGAIYDRAPSRKLNGADCPTLYDSWRINLGLAALMGELGATRNWRKIAEELWPFVDGPPATPMGELEHRWAVAHQA